MQIQVQTPPNYDEGAFQIVVVLDRAERELVRRGPPVAFELPELANRRVYPDHSYSVADPASKKVRGMLRAGRIAWAGHCYTNGIAERDNPTPIEDVRGALDAAIRQALDAMRAWPV